MRDAMAPFWSVERTDGARLVGWLVILGTLSDILGHFLSFFHGLGDPSQLPVGDADADADADADVALAWVPVTVPRTWLQCIMIDVFEVHVFLSLGPWPMGHDVWFFSSCFCEFPDRISSLGSRCRWAHILHVMIKCRPNSEPDTARMHARLRVFQLHVRSAGPGTAPALRQFL